ncbi:hypothetical protein BU25DRAFT_455291 [Macroventuria anomochaeta]|uniref:Uncharacterized protein n=1 Tax=Macroventuria anomochaeta TaxID=301207 RepID=A0ACB6SAE1_9PLEO|nr:uncharacterized protein BU25DRAFT_455291 [Macroventuria anomochaeta]KAF2630943.1 hypothetical protein BU25DRAFT_455291 [Macroventuria anomochaeta]
MAEMGQNERNVSANALTIACELIRASKDKKAKTAILPGKVTASRYVITLTGDEKRPGNVIREVEEPDLERDVGILDDFTDDDAVWSKDSTASVDDDESVNGEESGIAAAKPEKSKGKGKKAERTQDEDLEDQARNSQVVTVGLKRGRDEDSDNGEGSSKAAAKVLKKSKKDKRRKSE